jgi:hypothetical protein
VGVSFVTIVRNFYIRRDSFGPNDHDVQDGCVTPGQHRVLRFDFLSHNAGDADLVVGSPAARPDLFVWSAAHGHDNQGQSLSLRRLAWVRVPK